MDSNSLPPPIQEKGFVLVGSDVEKLFPSLKPLEAARLTRIAIQESNVEFDNIDVKLGLRYLFVVGGRKLLDRMKLIRLCPKWLGKREDLLSVGGKKTNDSNYWKDTDRDIFPKDRRNVVAAVLEIGILITMGTHLYCFNGVVYVQLRGGPIGLRLTAALANLVMSFFDQTFDKILHREGIVVNIKFRFVDDGRVGLRPIRAGWRWAHGGICHLRFWWL